MPPEELDLLDQILESFAARVCSERINKQLSQQELATRSGLSMSTISRIEAGTINPSLTTLHSLAEGLHIPLEDLVKGLA